MSSPVPPDPYDALGVSKDVDISAIRAAHRKLVLKHHPDRIQDPALKEKGKDAFQKIQRAYELLSDPVLRSRYDDKIKLAELRKESMMRGPPRTHSDPMRPPTHSASSSREWNKDDQAFHETRRPRESDFDSKESFDLPNRTTSRKHPDYDRTSSTKKPERHDRSAKAAWGVATDAVKNGIRVKKDTDKTKSDRSHQSKQETKEKRQARMDKDRRAYFEDDSDSDNATRVTSSTVRPSKSVPRQPQSSARSSAGHARRAYTDDDSDTGTYVSSMKWERGHYEGAKEYMEKAAAASGHRPSISRGDSFWGPRKGGNDGERRPTSSGGRRNNSYDELPTRPPMPPQTSAPVNLKARVDERAPKERRSATGTYSDLRKEKPNFSRSQTMPAQRPSSRRDAAPPKSSHLKHGETQDSGYGSSSPHTPEIREESPPRRPKPTSMKSSTKYQIVDPSESDDDRRTTIRVLDDEGDRRRYQRSPEHDPKESDRRREKDRGPERPRVDVRSKSTRDIPVDPPKPRRTDSSKYRDEPQSPRELPRETPVMSRHASGRARERVHGDVSDEGEKPYQYKYASGEKVNVRSPYQDPQFAKYRDSPDRRNYFPEGFSTSRRPSVPAHG